MAHLELAQPIIELEDPQIKIPRARPIALITGTTAIVPVKDMGERVKQAFGHLSNPHYTEQHEKVTLGFMGEYL